MKQARSSWKITNKSPWIGVTWQEFVAYKDLLHRMVRKEILLYYQQTLLGPLWMILQPLLTVLAYVVVFDKVIGLPTDDVPSFLFYLTGITIWGLFSDIFNGVSTTFSQNAQIFSKVYFPRIIAPLSTVIVHLLRFIVQLMLLVFVIAYYYFSERFTATGNWLMVLPVIIITAGIAFGSGLLFAVVTVTYRDLNNFQQLIVRLLMFLSPIFYSLSMVSDENKHLININPLSPVFESFRLAVLGKGEVSVSSLIYSTVFMLVVCVAGLLFFNKKSDALIDVI